MLGQKRSASMFASTAPKASEQAEKLTEVIKESPIPAQQETYIPEEDAPTVAVKPIAAGRAHSLFFTPEDDGREFSDVCREVQGYIAANYSGLMTGGGTDSREQIRRYAAKYIQDKRIAVKGMTTDELGYVDFGYAPPFAGVWDAVAVAANAAK